MQQFVCLPYQLMRSAVGVIVVLAQLQNHCRSRETCSFNLHSTRTPPPDARDQLRGRQRRDVPGVTGDVPRGAVGHGHPPEGFH